MENDKITILNDEELSTIKGGEGYYYVPGYGYTNLLGEITVTGDPSIIQMKDYAWSGTENKYVYTAEVFYNTFIFIYNGYAYIVNRM